MRMILATASLALLAACGGGASNNSAGNAASGANTSAPASTAAAPANPQRENELRECADDVRTELPAGSDLNAFCGCAVDKMQTGLREREAMEQCAAQLGIRPNN